ncbi:gamma-glutamyltransferase family protein [Roseovarius sp. C7]|uniref:gamma-glutamyltransferase family protein n=1 Tax=Roseovarius sp. C7 TaxID=3398643 RepID=UPI0039F659D7
MRDFHRPGRSPVLAQNGMCATSHPLASQVAIATLQEGGNAMDAAIAGAVLLGLCEPQMTGLGGDCFVLWGRPGEEIKGYNGSGRAPAALDAADLRARGLDTVPLQGVEAVTIPGAVEAFCTLSETEGKLGIDRLLAPAIRYFDEGVPVASRVAFDWPEAGKALKSHGKTHFFKDGRPYREGEIFASPAQAEALRHVARDGKAGFYQGPVAEDMVNSLRAEGGVHSLEDFANHTGNLTTPISGYYKGTELIEHPPNGQGATGILMANILSRFDIAAMDPWGAERAHIEAEAAKLAYDARDRIIADPDHTARVEFMLSEDLADTLAGLIDPSRAMTHVSRLTEAVHKETIYITVVDRDRMAVSLIYSTFHGFGAGLASETFGIGFQNRGAGFTLSEGHPNELKGGKRPMHTIIPGVLRDTSGMLMPFGVMGGAYQPNGHARLLSNLVDFEMDIQAAIDAPRAFAAGGKMQVERGYDESVRAKLSEMGHDVVIPETAIGGAQAIVARPDGVLVGGSDPRKDGCALGY